MEDSPAPLHRFVSQHEKSPSTVGQASAQKRSVLTKPVGPDGLQR